MWFDLIWFDLWGQGRHARGDKTAMRPFIKILWQLIIIIIIIIDDVELDEKE